MKHFRALLPLLFTIPVFTSAQYIASNNRTSGPNPGTGVVMPPSQEWVKEEDQVNGKINSARLVKMKGVTAGIVNLFRDSLISDDRYAALWHGEYYSEKTSPGPLMKSAAICNFVDQRASLQVVANDISPLLNHIVLNNQDFLTIRPVTAVKGGCPYFEYNSGNGEINKAWLITGSNDQLPYIPVARKEYLNEALKELTGLKSSILADMKDRMPVRSAAVQEAEKKAALDRLANMYSGTELQVHTKIFLQHYRTDEEYLKEHVDQQTADIDSTMHLMEHLLTHLPAAELARPAIVSVQAADFQGFEDNHGGKMLIRINTAFFNACAGGEKPRFFVVSLSYDPSESLAAGLDRQMHDKFNVQALQDMIGK